MIYSYRERLLWVLNLLLDFLSSPPSHPTELPQVVTQDFPASVLKI